MTAQQIKTLRRLRALAAQHPAWQPLLVKKLREAAAETGQDEYELLAGLA